MAMKPLHTTLLLTLVFLGLGTYVYMIEFPAAHQEVAEAKAAKQILPFDDRAVLRLEVKTRTETMEMSRDERYRWAITQPIKTRADSRAVQNLLRALTIGKVTRVFSNQDTSLAEYGLADPRLILTLDTGKHVEVISLGNVDPISSGLYAFRQSDQQTLLTTLSVQDFRKKTLFSFRQKEILPINRFLVTQFELQFGASDLILTQIPSAHGLSGEWKFLSPYDAPADKTSVNVLLMALEELEAIGFVDPGSGHEQLWSQLTSPTVKAILTIGRQQQEIQFYFPASPTEKAYAVRSKEDPIYQIDPKFIFKLPREDFDLQDKRLFGMEVREIALLKVKQGKDEYTLVQQHNDWVLEDHPDRVLDRPSVNLFVSRIVDLPSEIRVQREDNHFEQFGLDHPSVEISGIDTRGRPTGSLILGKASKGLVYAKGARLPGVHQARSNIFNQILTKDSLLQNTDR